MCRGRKGGILTAVHPLTAVNQSTQAHFNSRKTIDEGCSVCNRPNVGCPIHVENQLRSVTPTASVEAGRLSYPQRQCRGIALLHGPQKTAP